MNALGKQAASTAAMIFIPGGTFRMGSDHHYAEEAPAHSVAVDGFWIDPTPVTNAQFRALVAATKLRLDVRGDIQGASAALVPAELLPGDGPGRDARGHEEKVEPWVEGKRRMTKSRRVQRAIIFFSSLWLATGCVGTSAQVQPPQQLANPASQHCVARGGTLESNAVPTAVRFGVCVFTDNYQCEEWAMLRGECPAGGLARDRAT